jgi:hypothetical protein
MKKSDLVIIPHIVINPSNIVCYSEVIGRPRSAKSSFKYIDTSIPVEEQSKFLCSSRKAGGVVSSQAKRKLEKSIEYLVTISREKKQFERLSGKTVIFRTAFLTLTLPSKQLHSDKVIINRCLNSFLNEIRQYHAVKHYVWRAELQKNGNIHFHILTDTFIPWYEARNRWNRIVNKLGYVDRFQAKNGKKTPNSTDIHSTRKIKDLKKYLSKYMAKMDISTSSDANPESKLRLQEGRIWSCNHELSQAKGCNLEVDSEIEKDIKCIIDSGKAHIFKSDYFSVIYFDFKYLPKIGANALFKYFCSYLYEHLNFSYQSEMLPL